MGDAVVQHRLSVELVWGRRRASNPRRQGEIVLEALVAVGDAVRLTALSVSVERRPSEELPPRWSFVLERMDALQGGSTSDEVDPGVVRRSVDRIDRGAVAALVGEALSSQGGQVWLSSVDVDGAWREGDGELHVELWDLSDLTLEIEWDAIGGRHVNARVESLIDRLVAIGWRVQEPDEDELVDDDGPLSGAAVTIQLGRGAPDDPLERAGLAIDALVALSSLAALNRVQFELAFSERRAREPRQAHYAVVAGASPGRSVTPRMVLCTVSRVDGETLRDVFRDALAPRRPAGISGVLPMRHAVTWRFITATAPDPAGGGNAMTITARDEGAALRLEIHLDRPAWADPGAAGRAAVERAVGDLCAVGWRRVPGVRR